MCGGGLQSFAPLNPAMEPLTDRGKEKILSAADKIVFLQRPVNFSNVKGPTVDARKQESSRRLWNESCFVAQEKAVKLR